MRRRKKHDYAAWSLQLGYQRAEGDEETRSDVIRNKTRRNRQKQKREEWYQREAKRPFDDETNQIIPDTLEAGDGHGTPPAHGVFMQGHSFSFSLSVLVPSDSTPLLYAVASTGLGAACSAGAWPTVTASGTTSPIAPFLTSLSVASVAGAAVAPVVGAAASVVVVGLTAPSSTGLPSGTVSGLAAAVAVDFSAAGVAPFFGARLGLRKSPPSLGIGEVWGDRCLGSPSVVSCDFFEPSPLKNDSRRRSLVAPGVVVSVVLVPVVVAAAGVVSLPVAAVAPVASAASFFSSAFSALVS